MQADPAAALEDCLSWLDECGAVMTGADDAAELAVDCKASSGVLQMPADKEAVAHGDANLAIGAPWPTLVPLIAPAWSG